MESRPPSADVTMDADATQDTGIGPSRSTPRSMERGRVVGRYVIIEPLGMGGMGVVYAAYDPDLDRKIALKLLSPAPGGAGQEQRATARLLHEAQAMARLNHPNVVTVHDVGTVEGGVFIAMEYLDGGTLGTWRKQTEPSLEQILDHYVRAGRGLVAAHEAGLVHRDFKPDNVLLGRDGRVRVCDFGLAREHDHGDTTEPMRADEVPVTLTRTGALMGTPAYMAPEQHMGEPADVYSDQFSYCVSLFEALAGRRPWQGETLAALATAVLEQPAQDLPSSVPERVRTALRRGLARDPAERWRSMEALLAELSDDGAGRRRWWWVAGAVAVVGLAVAASWATRPKPETPCTGGRARVEPTWSEARKLEIAAAIEGSGPEFAKEMAPIVTAQLDEYASEWVEGYTDACRATRVLGEQSEALLDRRMSCLDRRLVALGATVDVLAQTDADNVAGSVTAVASLPSLAMCRDRDALLALVEPPADAHTAAAVEDALALVSRAEALRAAGRYDEAAELAEQQVRALEEVGYEPALAEALLVQGNAYEELSRLDEAVAAFERGFRLALATGDDRLAAKIAATLIYTAGYQKHDVERGELWAGHADALVKRTGSDPYLASLVIAHRGSLMFVKGRMREALAEHEKALELRIEALGEDHEKVWSIRSNIASILAVLGEYDEAFPRMEAVIAAGERRKGPRHPDVAGNLVNYAAALVQADRDADGRAALERALEIRREALGPDHAALIELYGNLGASHFRAGELDEAEKLFQRSRELAELHHSEPDLATALGHLANLTSTRGDPEEAERLYRRALEIQKREMGVHPFIAVTLQNLSALAYRRRDWPQVLELSLEAADVLEQSIGPEAQRLFDPLYNVGVAQRELGDLAASETTLRRALSLADVRKQPTMHADASWQLARTLEAQGRLDEARTLTNTARDLFAAHGANDEDDAREARRWLAEHPP